MTGRRGNGCGAERRRGRIVLGALALMLAACTYGPEEDRVRIGPIVRLGESDRALVVVRHDRLRPATGLSAFPDGGRARILLREVVIHRLAATTGETEEIARWTPSDSVWGSLGVGLRGVEGDSAAYLSLNGCPRGGECDPPLDHTFLFRVTHRGLRTRVAEVPEGYEPPGTMVARRPGERLYVRFGSDGDTIAARLEEGGETVPLARVLGNGSLESLAVSPRRSPGVRGTADAPSLAPSASQPCFGRDPSTFAAPDTAGDRGPFATLGRGSTPFSVIDLGVGHLVPSRDAPLPDLRPGAYDWLGHVELPLSEAPGDEPDRWLVDGWIVEQDGVAAPLLWTGLLETGYEEVSLVVLEHEGDSWLRVRYGEAPDATAWLPRCALTSGPIVLEESAWEAWLLDDERGPLELRTEDGREVRRDASAEAEVAAEASPGHGMRPLEVRGDWMRVILSQPSDYCDPEVTPVVTEGWIRWRDTAIGPRVWYPTRGC